MGLAGQSYGIQLVYNDNTGMVRPERRGTLALTQLREFGLSSVAAQMDAVVVRHHVSKHFNFVLPSNN